MAALLLEWQVGHKCTKNLFDKGSGVVVPRRTKNLTVYTILLTTPRYHNLLSVVCALVEISGVHWMESPRVPHVSGTIRTLTIKLKTGQ